MNIVRKTKTVCPECVRELDGVIVQEGDAVYVQRECPEHGLYEFQLSKNGALYADFDRFFFEVLRGKEPGGRITNLWILASADCQMKCKYCSAGMGRPEFADMTLDDLKRMLDEHGHLKLTISGGEPTLHPHVLDFFREAAKRGIATQLATNGVKLASMEFCKQLADAGVTEVRLSLDSLNREQTAALGSEAFYDAKLRGIENLGELHIATSLSPTIFKGINEDQLVATIEFARDKPFIRSISVNGFAWIGDGRALDRDAMIMPDEMMDLLAKRYFPDAREDGFTFQKVMFALMQAMGIRLCLYTQLMVFVRSKSGLQPITHFLDMKRLKRAMKWWERFAHSGRFPMAVALGMALTYALRARSLKMLPCVWNMFLANLFKIKIDRYPSTLLSVNMNTNCSVLNLDEAVQPRCMSNYVLLTEDGFQLGVSTHALLEREKRELRKI